MRFRSFLGSLLTNPGFRALFLYRICYWLWLHKYRNLALLMSAFIRQNTGIEILPGAKLSRSVQLSHGQCIVIGETAEVGEHVVLLHGVTLGARNREDAIKNPNMVIHPKLEDYVTVYTGAVLLGPITIGHHATIGANSVVTKDIPAGAIVAGIPGKVLRINEDYMNKI